MSNGLVLSKPTESLITHTPSRNPDAKPEAFTAGKRGTAAEAVIRTLIQHPSFGDGTGFHFLSGNTGSNEGPIWQAIQDVTGLKGLVHGATEFVATCMASGSRSWPTPAPMRARKGFRFWRYTHRSV